VDVYGVSFDSVVEQAQFAKEQELTFPLLSDPDGSAALKYGVHAGGFARRVTFIIDEKGNLRHVDTGVQVATHGDDLIERVYELQTE
jgi:peroxiredoxin Q/BCP